MATPAPPASRAQQLGAATAQPFDVIVVGAGINGAVTAAALAARGARVALVDQGDFAGETSMHSSNLAWGGIKYMEGLEFGLVRKLCVARNALMRAYPTAVRETRFLTTVPRGFRWPRWFLYLGAWLYWVIGSFFTKPPRLLSKRQLQREQPLLNVESSVGGFEYSDAHLVDGDARFVFSFVRSAFENGAVVLNYVKVEDATFDGEQWSVSLVDQRPPAQPGATVAYTARARVLVNACGPYADVVNRRAGIETAYRHVLSKGVHLNVRRLAEGERILAFFASDGRLFFAIPLGSRSSIGTTDTRTSDTRPQVTDEDRQFILDNINDKLRLEKPLTRDDIISERCGVRPLVVAKAAKTSTGDADWTALSRKHVIEVRPQQRHITVFGGKITDCLNVGDELAEAVEQLGVPLGEASTWYGEGTPDERGVWLNQAPRSFTEATAVRMWRCYGARSHRILALVDEDPSLAAPLYPDADVVRAEAVYAGRYEYVETVEDFLRRRTHLAQELSSDALRADGRLTETARLLFQGRVSRGETT